MPKAAVLKLGVATLLRVAKCPQRVTKFAKKKNLAFNATNKPKTMGLRWYFLQLQGHKIPLGLRDFSVQFRGRQPKKFENPWPKG